MVNIFLSCVKTKRKYRCKAKDMYISPLFIKSLEVARKITNDKHIFILSAKYGLLRLDDIIEPYNETLVNTPIYKKIEWGSKIINQAKVLDIELNGGIYLCGEAYLEGLKDIKKRTPLKGLSMGNRLKYFNKILNK